VTGESNPHIPVFARARDLFQAHEDALGVHLCELAEARASREEGPIPVLRSLVAPLERLVASGSLGGLDVICVELLLAAVALESDDLEARIRDLLSHAGSNELASSVLLGLWEEVQDLRDTGDLEAAIRVGRTSLETSVAVGDFNAAATSLIFLAGCHDVGRRPDAVTLCIRQAGAYLAGGGEPTAAGEVLMEAADRLEAEDRSDDAIEALGRASRAWDEAGAETGVILCLLEVARLKAAAGRDREAVKGLQKAAAMAGEAGLVEMEIRALKGQATAYASLGESVMAENCLARAELLAGALSQG